MGDDNLVVVEAAGHLVLPGFVDAHLHAWEGQLRGLAPGATFEHYVAIAHQRLGAAYRPEDVYAGTLMSALQCLNAGVTGIIDNFHNHRSPDHGDAAQLEDCHTLEIRAYGVRELGRMDLTGVQPAQRRGS